ncbi:MAG: hypothetical protein QXP98_03010 [Thermoproteus sp.]
MPLRIAVAAGVAASLAQFLFLEYFAAPLAESLHAALAAEGEEEYAIWAAFLAAAIAGGLWGAVFHYFAVRWGVATGALMAFAAFSLLPGLKWLPTPHGVSYAEPIWWRETVHGLYMLYNAAALWLASKWRSPIAYVLGAVALVAGFYAFPSFTLPDRYLPYVPELRALQGLALSSWALFWALAASLTWTLSPIRRPWRSY